jgi:hypothetical protein
MAMIVGPYIGAAFSKRVSGTALLATGLLLIGAGNLVTALVAGHARYWLVALGMAVTGFGAGVPLTCRQRRERCWPLTPRRVSPVALHCPSASQALAPGLSRQPCGCSRAAARDHGERRAAPMAQAL